MAYFPQDNGQLAGSTTRTNSTSTSIQHLPEDWISPAGEVEPVMPEFRVVTELPEDDENLIPADSPTRRRPHRVGIAPNTPTVTRYMGVIPKGSLFDVKGSSSSSWSYFFLRSAWLGYIFPIFFHLSKIIYYTIIFPFRRGSSYLLSSSDPGLRPNAVYEAAVLAFPDSKYYSTIYSSHSCVYVPNVTPDVAFDFISHSENSVKYQSNIISCTIPSSSPRFGLGTVYNLEISPAYLPGWKYRTWSQNVVSEYDPQSRKFTLSGHNNLSNNYFTLQVDDVFFGNGCVCKYSIANRFNSKLLDTMLRVCFGRQHMQTIMDKNLDAYMLELKECFEKNIHDVRVGEIEGLVDLIE